MSFPAAGAALHRGSATHVRETESGSNASGQRYWALAKTRLSPMTARAPPRS